MGEVISMFGGNEKGPFGTMGSSSLGAAEEEVGGEVEAQAGPPAAGAPEPQMAPVEAVLQELDIALEHARVAQHGLVDLVPPGSIDAATYSGLHSTYATLQQNIGEVASRARAASSQEELLAVNRDAQEVLQQVQQYVESVQTILSQVPSAPPAGGAALAPARAPGNGKGVLVAALVIGLGVTGWGVWQIQQRRKKRK